MIRYIQFALLSIAWVLVTPSVAAVSVQHHTALTIIVSVPGFQTPNAPHDVVAQTLFATGTELVSTNYRIATYGQIDFVGSAADVVGPYTVSPSGNICAVCGILSRRLIKRRRPTESMSALTSTISTCFRPIVAAAGLGSR